MSTQVTGNLAYKPNDYAATKLLPVGLPTCWLQTYKQPEIGKSKHAKCRQQSCEYNKAHNVNKAEDR